MSLDPVVLLAIVIMWAVSYACRAGGYAVLRITRPPAFIDAMLRHLPGALFVAYVVPAMSANGPSAWCGGAAAVLAQKLSGNFGTSVLAGVGGVFLARWLGVP
jgi:uncharacterized membrane protein